MDVTMKFEHYDGGIYSQKLKNPPQLNHEISVLGWGYDEQTGKEYWIGRNSWGKTTTELHTVLMTRNTL